MAGYGGQKKEPVTESQSVENTSQREEKESVETESRETEEPESVETKANAETEVPAGTDIPSEEKSDKQEESKSEETPEEKKKTTTPETSNEADAGQEKEKKEPATAPAEPEKPKTVAYNPSEVVSLATAKTKAYGKISIPEDLDRMLAAGEITKAEYDEYYPYDGAGYYSVFVETDLNQAATTSGRKLGSVEGIADYIAEMLSLESGPYFYIEYAGKTSTGGTEFYEFRCYRA